MNDERHPRPDVNGVINPGQWRKGQSGNPAGRPLGSRNRASLEMEGLLEGAVPRLTQQAIDRALEGSDNALKLCMQRVLPVMRSRPVAIALPAGATAEEVAAAMSETVRSMGAGEISPGEAADIIQVLEAQRRTVETIELERRLARLETLLEPASCASAPG
jgi:hypothetical protein